MDKEYIAHFAYNYREKYLAKSLKEALMMIYIKNFVDEEMDAELMKHFVKLYNKYNDCHYNSINDIEVGEWEELLDLTDNSQNFVKKVELLNKPVYTRQC